MEHHSNIVPWHFLRERNGAVLKWVDTLTGWLAGHGSPRESADARKRLLAP
jgi:selenocysteine lyase/cysteine desulfurase